MTGFGKTFIVHTSNFTYLEIHKNQKEWYRDLKLDRDDKGIVVLQSLKFSHVSVVIPNRLYESPKLKNWMCELCTFSQIQSYGQCSIACNE